MGLGRQLAVDYGPEVRVNTVLLGPEPLDCLVDPSVFAFTDGRLSRPTGPGLGIVVDEAAVREADKRGHTWRSPIWRHPDQSFAEW